MFDEAIDFVDSEEVAEGFRSILRGWDIAASPHDPQTPAYVTFRKSKGGYRWNAPWLAGRGRKVDQPSPSPADAVCDFHYEFIDWFVDRNPDYFCLHTASAIFDAGAVLFPCIQKAGKSTLCLQLALSGHRLIGDDVVALEPNGERAVSLGILPRIRMPPPRDVVTKAYLRFVDARRGLSDRHWQYVRLDESEMAFFGESRPVRGVVILERSEAGPPMLEPISKGLAIKALIGQNFGLLTRPGAIFDHLRDLAMASECRRLRYSRPDDAVTLLEAEFGATRDRGTGVRDG